MSRLRAEHGMTLTELLIAMTLMLVVVGATLAVLSTAQGNARSSADQNDAQNEARSALRLLARDLRNVASPTQAERDPIDVATASDLVFKAVDPAGPASGANAANVRRVRYCLGTADGANKKIYFQYQKWTSAAAPAVPSTTSCPSSDSGWVTPAGSTSNAQVLAQHVTNVRGSSNRALFSYRATSDACAVAPVTTTCLPELIGLRATVYVDVNDAERRPRESELESGVSLRNQNKPPTAVIEYAPLGPGLYLLNATASKDPEGETLTYDWYVDGVTLGQGSLLKTRVLSVGTHVIKLKVTDSGGLTTEAQVEVNVSA